MSNSTFNRNPAFGFFSEVVKKLSLPTVNSLNLQEHESYRRVFFHNLSDLVQTYKFLASVQFIEGRVRLIRTLSRARSVRDNGAAEVSRMSQQAVNTAMAPLSPDSKELLLKMYDTLRKEIEDYMKQIADQATYGALATWIVWSTVLLNADKIGPRELLWLPAALSILFLVRTHAIRKTIHIAGDHLGKIEVALGLSEHLRWDGKEWKEHRSVWKEKTFLGLWQYLYWMLLFIFNAIAAFILVDQ